MKKIFLITIILCLSVNVFSQNITINGHGKDVAGKTIRLSIITDRLSMLEKDIEEKAINENDTNFSFSLTLSSPKEVIIKIDLYDYHFIAKPGQIYNLTVLPFDFSKDDSLASFIYKLPLPIVLNQEKDDGINNQILDFDTTFNNFLYSNHRLLFIKDSSSIASLNNIDSIYSNKYINNQYVLNYIKYSIADIKYGLNLTSRKQIKTNLFANSPILYDNIGYMDCFKTIFSQYFSKGYKFIKRDDLDFWLSSNNYNALSDALGRDKILENEIFRELVFLQGMKDAFLVGYFNKESIIKMINKFSLQTKFSENKEIANNLIEYLNNQDNIGKQYKDFTVKDIDNKSVTIKSFLNKPLILNFVRLSDEASLLELEAIHYYYDSIKDNCNILTISCDDNLEQLYNFLKNNKVGSQYKWNFAHFNKNFSLIDEYKIHFFPTFVLINKDGSIENNPMLEPSRGGLIKFIQKKDNK
ncbi:MAG: redoxin domain-containing protein [Bacteroidales bacterium]|jgi:hypothetical protein|nr:redoxin domain-containing protein [Bacteroidales bacterium]